MSLCIDFLASGRLSENGQTETQCTAYLLQTAAEVRAHAETLSSLTLETIGIDPVQILYVFSWGSGAVLSLWALGYAVGTAVQMIRKI